MTGPYLLEADGTATPVEWTPETEDHANTGSRRVFPTVVGAVEFGGVLATPIKIKVEQVYDGAHWLRTGELLPAGIRTTIKVEGLRL